jgi:DNA-binding IclR family transcriptional regulator
MTGGTSSVKRNQSVEKVISIIETMARARGPMRLQQVATDVSLPPSTVLRFLGTLMDADYVTQDSDTLRYSLTLKFCRLADLVRAQITIRDVVHPHLVEMADACGESTCLAIEEDKMVVYIDVVDGPDSMLQTLQRIGKRAPMHSTGVGKALLADFTRAQLDSLIAEHGLERLTDHTITRSERLEEELAIVRRQGYALDNEECESGVRCVAASVRDFSGKAVACISVSGPVTRMDSEKVSRCAEVIGSTADIISRRLGYELSPAPAVDE